MEITNRTAPAASPTHKKINDRHQTIVLYSVRVTADDEMMAWLLSLPLEGPGLYADWRCGRHTRVCVQRPRAIQVGREMRVRVTEEKYRSNFIERRLTLEALNSAVPDASKWERIPVATWPEARTEAERLLEHSLNP